MSSPSLRIDREPTGSPASRELRREFVAELARRYPEEDFSADAVTDELPVLDAPGAAWFVVRLDGEAVGCGGLRGLDEHTGEIKWVYLRAAARGRAVGRSLLAELEDAGRAFGYTRMRLSTGDRQPEALGLYASAGYTPADDGLPGPHRLEKDLRPHADDVRLRFHKYDGSLHWHATLRRLGEDGHGTWLGGTRHTPWRRGSAPAVFQTTPTVTLVPHGGAWITRFYAPPNWTALYVDVVDRPVWTAPDEVSAVDLDLDVIRDPATAAAVLLDEDEFEQRRVGLGYPADLVAAARRTAAELAAAVTAAREPFGTASLPWLALMSPSAPRTK